MGGFLRSIGSPRLHAPQYSCLKHGENTVNTGVGQRNPYSSDAPLTTSFPYNSLLEKRHLSLPFGYSGLDGTRILAAGYSGLAGTAAANPAITPLAQQAQLVGLFRPRAETGNIVASLFR